MTNGSDPRGAPPTRKTGFRHVLGIPGALRFSTAGFMTRIPLATMALALMFLIVAETGSYTVGGVIIAAYSISRAVCAPFLGRLVDRHGQARVMSWAVLLQVVFLFLLALGIVGGWHIVVLVALAVIAGVGTGSPPALVRARWSNLLQDSRSLTAAFSWESIVEETAFIVGPVIVALIVTELPPIIGVAFAVACLAVGSALLYSQRSTEPAPQPKQDCAAAPRASAAAVGIIALSAGFYFCVAVALGAVDVYAVALADVLGAPWAAGVIIALLAAGSMVSAFIYGSVTWRSTPQNRFVVIVPIFILTTLSLLLPRNLVVTCLIVVLIGASVSAMLTTANLAAREVAPPDRLTEVLTWMTTAMGLGISLGTFVSGVAIDAAGAEAGANVVAGSGALAALILAVGPAARRIARGREPIAVKQ